MRRLLPLLILAVLLVAGGVALVRPWYGGGHGAVTVTIPRGATLRVAAERMKRAGAISSAQRFLLLARLLGSDAPIRAGEYRFGPGGWGDYLRQLQSGEALQHLIIVPEGMPSALVMDRLAAEPLLTGPVPQLAEGSVLPQGYGFERGEARAAVAARMQAAMAGTLKTLWAARSPRAVVKTPEEAVTLASIVEKETGVPAERRMIAGVYSNRLRIGMKLDADPTIIYPITKGRPLGRRILLSEKTAVNGYNTYTKPGLPVGPIANPGRESIAAVLDPAETDALFFVADGRGGHVFAATIAEHNRNVAKWFAIRRARGEL